MTAAVCQDSRALEFAAKDLKSDLDVALAAAHFGDGYLSHASTKIKKDPEVARQAALTAASRNGFALRYVPIELRDDRNIVLAAVTHSGGALDLVSRCRSSSSSSSGAHSNASQALPSLETAMISAAVMRCRR